MVQELKLQLRPSYKKITEIFSSHKEQARTANKGDERRASKNKQAKVDKREKSKQEVRTKKKVLQG